MASSSRKSPLLLLGLVVVGLAASVPVAVAIEANPTRAEYVEAVEPICKTNSEANARILKGVKGQVKSGKLAPAGRRFARASTALGKTVRQIAAVPQPSADQAKLGKWIGYLEKEKAYLQKIGAFLEAKDKYEAQKQAVQLNRNNGKANDAVIGFGFHECRIESSRFL